MDGENNEKPYEQIDDLGGLKNPIFGSTPIYTVYIAPINGVLSFKPY